MSFPRVLPDRGRPRDGRRPRRSRPDLPIRFGSATYEGFVAAPDARNPARAHPRNRRPPSLSSRHGPPEAG